MKHALAAMFALLVVFNEAFPQQQAKPTDYEALASKLVNQCAGIREGDLVFINGGARDLELLEDITVNVRKLGAFPLVTFSSDRMARRLVAEVPAKYDSQVPGWWTKLSQLVTAQINVEWNETPDLFLDLPPERLVAMGNAAQPINDLILKRNVRQVSLGNGLYPTAALAKQFGMPLKQLTKIFWEGVNVDYSKLQATGERVKAALAGGKELHITNPNGTDLTMRIESRPVFASDGVISADDEKRGGAACAVWLPAGEVYLAPVAGTAEGTVVVDKQFFGSKEIVGLTLTFRAGKLTSMTAKSGLDPFKKYYDAADKGKELFGYVDIGINPSVQIPRGNRMVGYVPAGMVTVGFGQNAWAGGDNSNSYSSQHFLPGYLVSVDGKVLVEKGVLKE